MGIFFFSQSVLVWRRRWEMGAFGPRNPLIPILGILTPVVVQGRWIRNPFQDFFDFFGIITCLGGHFGPEKKCLPPPPPLQETFPQRPSPSRASSSETPSPPLSIFYEKKKTAPPPPGHLLGHLLPLPRPGTEKNKKYLKRPPRCSFWVGSVAFKRPRDLPALKILRRVNFGMGRKFGTDAAQCYGEGSEMLVFLGKRCRKTVYRM